MWFRTREIYKNPDWNKYINSTVWQSAIALQFIIVSAMLIAHDVDVRLQKIYTYYPRYQILTTFRFAYVIFISIILSVLIYFKRTIKNNIIRTLVFIEIIPIIAISSYSQYLYTKSSITWTPLLGQKIVFIIFALLEFDSIAFNIFVILIFFIQMILVWGMVDVSKFPHLAMIEPGYTLLFGATTVFLLWTQQHYHFLIKRIFESRSELATKDHIIRALSEKEKLFNQLQTAAKIAFWEFNLKKNQFHPTPQLFKILKLDPNQFSKPVLDLNDFLSLIHPDDRKLTAAWIKESSIDHSDGILHRFEDQYHAPRSFWSLNWREFDSKGEVVRLVGFSQDITDEKSLRESLPHITRLASIGELASVVAHELKNPLTLIYNYLEMIEIRKEKGEISNGQLSALLLKLRSASDRLNRVAQGLRTFSIQSQTHLFLVDVNQAILASIEIFKDLFPKDKTELVLNLSQEQPNFVGSEEHMQTVLLNLLTNAKDAMRNQESPRIEIKSYVTGTEIKIEVSDNGEGLTSHQIEDIFKPYVSTKQKGKGMGLGLSICKTLVNEMNGQITGKALESGGMQFSLTFPAPPS